jgi:hypothetical protein
VVEEERTGTPLLLKLDSPQLAVLFELHNPRPNDRIGIKCTGQDPDGSGRFIMMVERDSRSQQQHLDTEDHTEDYYAGACPEERAFIEQMLTDELPSDDSHECPADEGPHIMGVLNREEECLSRQSKSLERLEALISKSSRTEDEVDQQNVQNLYQPIPDFVAVPYPEAKAKSKRRWLRATLITLWLLTTCGLGIAYLFMYKIMHWPY